VTAAIKSKRREIVADLVSCPARRKHVSFFVHFSIVVGEWCIDPLSIDTSC
jgi:hypothetical protein